jgi:hypothetical protein
MYTTIIHPIRKALCLSVEEYVVLDTIYHLSNNQTYGHWCIMSKRKLAEVLDLSERVIYRTLKTLELKELITRDESTGYVKTLDNFNEMIANKDDWIIGFKGKETAFLSGKNNFGCQNGSGTAKLTAGYCQNGSVDTAKMADNIYKDNNNDKNSSHSLYARARARDDDYVKMPIIEYSKICDDFGQANVDKIIDEMNLWIKSTGKTYKDYPSAVRMWLNRADPIWPKEKIKKATDQEWLEMWDKGKKWRTALERADSLRYIAFVAKNNLWK